jgi:DNA modification methylase
MGSGTTAVACIKEKRNFLGSEIDENYYEVLTKRINNEQSQPTLF